MPSGRCQVLVLVLFLLGGLTISSTQETRLGGFTPSHSRQQRQMEQRFSAVPDGVTAEAEHAVLTLNPHLAGSAADRQTAEYVQQQFRNFGLEASIEQFDVLLSEPREVKLDLLAPVRFSGPTPELPRASKVSIGFNAYSASADVTNEVIFANLGRPSDYEFLRSIGVSAEGKVVIVRRGDSESFRGVKARVAEEHKAAGLLIYSDPDDDGYHAGDPFPVGPWRPAWGVQRGTLLYEFLYPGDPTTPNGPSTPGVPRTDVAHSDLLPHIPVMPLSYSDGKKILENIGGPSAPRPWQGGLPITYHIGPGPAKVRVHIQMDTRIKPIWVVVARITGLQHPGELILLGNHRDAWTFGGVDPGTGTVAMLETARGLGELMRGGWRPRRSIWLCSWDAEEQGMIGSTEWAEAHAAELGEKAVAYLNLDVAAAGAGNAFNAAAVPSLKGFLREVASDIPDPQGGSVLEQAMRQQRDQRLLTSTSGTAPSPPIGVGDSRLSIDNIGSGTDYVAFLDHLGIASTDFGFGDEYGAYHSILDDHRYVKQFADPEFRYQVTAARYFGVLALRLSEADLLPFDYEAYAEEIETYLSDVQSQLVPLNLADRLDVGPAQNAARRLAEVAGRLQRKYNDGLDKASDPAELTKVNRILALAERAFLLPGGLAGRPWYKHAVFAPGLYSADAPMPLPAVQESVNGKNIEEARRQVAALTAAINRITDQFQSLAGPR